MSRLVPPARPLLTLALLGGLLASPLPAQPPAADPPGGWGIDEPDNPDLPDVKELAKAKYEAVHADPRELARQRVVVAREWTRARLEELVAGRGTLDVLQEASQRLTEAELAVHDRPEEQVAILERGWERAWDVERMNQERFKAARLPLADYAWSTSVCLEAQIRWLRARARVGKDGGARGSAPLPPLWPRLEEPHLPGPEDFPAGDLAEAKRAALQADPRELAGKRAAAIRVWNRCRMEEFLAGRGTLFILLEAGQRLADAEVDLADSPQGRAAAIKTHWAQAWQIDAINTARFAAGRVPIADYLETRYVRLGAEVRWLRARPSEGRERTPEKGFPWSWRKLLQASGHGATASDIDLAAMFDVEAFARAEPEALQANPRDLERERRTVARDAYQARWEEFLAGRGWLDLLLDFSHQWLDADLAVSENSAERAAAWERHWTRSKRIELINEGRFAAGRVPIADMMQSRYVRLDAEIGWAEARAAQEKK